MTLTAVWSINEIGIDTVVWCHIVLYRMFIDFYISCFVTPMLALQCCSQMYELLVITQLEFSSQVWSPHYKCLIDKIESVQRYFTKRLFGFSKLSYYERLISLDLDTLQRRRLIYDLILCYKMIHGWCNISLPVDYACRNTRGNYLKLNKQFCSTNVRKYFFSSRVVDAWNSLSDDVVKSPSVAIFKKQLHHINCDKFLTITWWLFLAVYLFFIVVILSCRCYFIIYVFADDILAIMYIFYCNVSGLCALLLLLLNK